MIETISQVEEEVLKPEIEIEKLEQDLQNAKSTLNIKKIKEINEQLLSLKHEKIVEEVEPQEQAFAPKKILTLEDARENLEYELLKQYLKSKPIEEQKNFLFSQVNLGENVLEKLKNTFSIGE